MGPKTVWIAIAAIVAGLGGGLTISRAVNDEPAAEVLGRQATAPPTTPPATPVSPPPAEATEPPQPTPIVVVVTPAPTSPPTQTDRVETSRNRQTTSQRTAPPRPAQIDCSQQAHLCSRQSRQMEVQDGRIANETSSMIAPPGQFPTFTMTSTAHGTDGQPAGENDEVSKLVIEARIVNETSKTFVFPDGELWVDMTRDGQPVKLPVAREGRFEMGPDAELMARFEVPVSRNGSYQWTAKTWYYEA